MPALAIASAFSAKPWHGTSGHLEVDYFVRDRLDGCVRRNIKRSVHQVPIEDHMQVLVGRYPGEELFGDRTSRCPAGVAVADPRR